MTLIVKAITRLVVAFIVIFGANLVAFGHLTPGGGFPGGVVLACAFILVTLAFGREYVTHFVTQVAAGIWDGVGALAFLTVGLVGYAGGVFFINFLHPYAGPPFKLFSSGTMLISNLAIGMKVGASLFLAFIGVSIYRLGATEDKGPKS